MLDFFLILFSTSPSHVFMAFIHLAGGDLASAAFVGGFFLLGFFLFPNMFLKPLYILLAFFFSDATATRDLSVSEIFFPPAGTEVGGEEGAELTGAGAGVDNVLPG